MKKIDLEKIYRSHHEKGGRYGYLYCHGERIPFIEQWIGTGKKILDLGCRDGMLTQGFSSGNEVVGADIDRNALDLCRKRIGIETVWVDLNREWPWEEASFDSIVACELIEHLFVLDSFLSRVAATVKPGGLVIGSTPNAFRLRNRWKFLWGREYEKDPTHVRQFSYEKLFSILGRFFVDVEIIPLGGKILPGLKVGKGTFSFLARLFGKDLLWKGRRPDEGEQKFGDRALLEGLKSPV